MDQEYFKLDLRGLAQHPKIFCCSNSLFFYKSGTWIFQYFTSWFKIKIEFICCCSFDRHLVEQKITTELKCFSSSLSFSNVATNSQLPLGKTIISKMSQFQILVLYLVRHNVLSIISLWEFCHKLKLIISCLIEITLCKLYS